MTDDTPGPGGIAAGPPWSVDTLADLHAGVLDEPTAAWLWPRVQADPHASEVIAALDTTTTDLGSLACAPTEAIPPEVANRIDGALAPEADRGHLAPVASITTPRRKRNRLLGWGSGIVTTAAAAVVAIAVISPAGSEQGEPNMAKPAPRPDAQSGPAAPGLALSNGDLGDAFGAVAGVRDLGPLGDEARLDACLTANDINPDRNPVGVRPGTIDGQRAVIVLYPTGESARYRLIALPLDCGRDNPGLLADKIIGSGGG